MNGIHNRKMVDGGHLAFIQSCARFIPSFVRSPLVPNWNCPIPIFLLNKDKPVLPPVNRRGFVKYGEKFGMPDDPIQSIPPAALAISLNDMGVGKG